jgi:HEAT repeat protein
MRIFTLALVLLGMAIGTTDAAETPDTATVKAVIKVFRKRFAEESMRVRMEALRELAETRHFLAVDEIGRRVLTDEDPEVRMAGALILARVGANPDRAGPFLRDLLAKNDDHPEVQVEFIRAIRKLDYRGAHRELVKAAMRFLEEDYRFVTAEVLMTFGAQKDVSSLPFMLKLAEYNTEKLRGRRGPAIRTGSSESTASRRAKWMKLYGKHMMQPGISQPRGEATCACKQVTK